MSEPPIDFPFFHVGDIAQHKISKDVSRVSRFAHGGTTDMWLADNYGHETGPYKQVDFNKLVSVKEVSDWLDKHVAEHVGNDSFTLRFKAAMGPMSYKK